MTMGVAIIGCGGIGEKRARALPEAMVLRSVFDPDEAAASRVGALGADAVVAPSVDAALGAEGVGLAIVATPHHLLAPTAIQAVRHGRHVLVEKPGASTLADLLTLRHEAGGAGTTVRVGFNHRFHPSVLRAREIVDSHEHGRVLNIRARYGHGGRLGYEREWRADRARSGGGELVDQGVHLIDLTRSMVGDVDLAFAETRTELWAMDVEDNAYLALRARSGAFAWLHASWTEWKNLFSFEVALERAKLELTGLGGSYGTETLRVHEMTPEMGPPLTHGWEWPRADESWALELADVVRVIAGESGIGASIDDAVETFRIVDEAYRA